PWARPWPISAGMWSGAIRTDAEKAEAMRLRSLLFAPGDSERKLAKSAGAKADVLILDLEDSVAPSQKQVAREMVRAYMANATGRGATQLWVRINPVDLPEAM